MAFSRAATRPKVFVFGELDANFKPIELSRSAGGARQDVCTFRYDLASAGKRLMDSLVPVDHDQRVELIASLGSQVDPGVDRPLFWGEVSRQLLSLGEAEESVTITARVERYHFGAPLVGIVVLLPPTGPEKNFHRPFILNPEVRGKIEPNQSTAFNSTYGYNYFFDPESDRTTAAGGIWSGQTRQAWTLIDAIGHLCWRLNSAEEHVRNPVRSELEAVLGAGEGDDGYDTTLLKNHHLGDGLYLPDCLDQLLGPYDYAWYLEPTWIDDFVVPRIRVFKLSGGDQVDVKLQRPGNVLDLDATAVKAFELDVDLAPIHNQITVRQSRRRREATFELFRAWPEEDDDLTADELALDQPAAKSKPRVWREWVLNEAGDYDALRPEIAGYFDLTDPLGTNFSYPRRRRFLPNLSIGPDGNPIGPGGVVVEWEKSPGVWERIPPEGEASGDWGYEILIYECGIRFVGARPPEALIARGADAKIRVTATVEADRAVQSTAGRQPDSPLGDTAELHLDLSRHYHDKQVFSILVAEPADEADDSGAALSYALDVRDRRDVARIAGTITLEGADHDETYQIGQVVRKVAGREINLNGRSASSTLAPLYPTIVGIRTRFEPVQETILVLGHPPQRNPDPRQFGGDDA